MTDRQPPRHEVRILGRYRSGCGLRREVTMLDVSETGARFYDRRSILRPDMAITVRIDNLGPFDAHVRWVRDDVVGVQFANPVYGPVFDYIRDTLSKQSFHPPVSH